jgi:hypothetical protein
MENRGVGNMQRIDYRRIGLRQNHGVKSDGLMAEYTFIPPGNG